jgi:hypothetical protein
VNPVAAIEVRAWGERVGAVARDPRLGYYAFQYAPAWKRTGIELAPLTLPLDGPDVVIFLLICRNSRSTAFLVSSPMHFLTPSATP